MSEANVILSESVIKVTGWKKPKGCVSPSLVGEHDESEQREDTICLTKDVLFEVFVRIPAEDLVGLRTVCKFWNELITSQVFARAHLMHWTLQPFSGGLVVDCWGDNIFYLFDLNSEGRNPQCCKFLRKKQTFDGQLRWNSKEMQVLDSCDGLILACYAEEGYYQLLVCNPITGSYTKLPPFRPKDYSPSHIYKISVFIWSLARSGSVGQYKVLGMVKGINASKRCYIYELPSADGNRQSVYNNWTELDVPLPPHWLIKASTSTGSKAHWLAKSYHPDESESFVVLTMDILKDKFWFTPFVKALSEQGHFFASNGTFCCIRPFNNVHWLWSLETRDDGVSWFLNETPCDATPQPMEKAVMLGGISKSILSFVNGTSSEIISAEVRNIGSVSEYLYARDMMKIIPHVSSLVECFSSYNSNTDEYVDIEEVSIESMRSLCI